MTMGTITLRQLRAAGASLEQLNKFESLFGARMTVSFASMHACAHDFAWAWVAESLLSGAAKRAYHLAMRAPSREYARATDPAARAYRIAAEPAERAYAAATKEFLRAYQRAQARCFAAAYLAQKSRQRAARVAHS